jgi:hypothetical protein
MDSSRSSRRVTRPTAKLADGSNVEKAPFAFQRVAVEAENARVKDMQESETRTLPNAESHSDASLPTLSQSDSQLPPASPSLVSTRQTSPALSDKSDSEAHPLTGTKHRRPVTPPVILSSDNEEQEKPENAPKKKKKRTHTANENSKCLTYSTSSLRSH